MTNKPSMESLRYIPETPDDWARTLFPKYFSYPFADRHQKMLDWAWAMELGDRPRPFVSIGPREGGKSTLAELVAVMLGALGKRKYLVYVRRNQAKADDSVSNIAKMLESKQVDIYYPELGQRRVGKFGNPQDWRRNRLRTSSGYTIDALGLDSAVRSAKIEEDRPDAFIFDDIDGAFDSPKVVQKWIDVITKDILPAGDGKSLAVLAVQNLIRWDGFFGRMASNKADYLTDRIVDGPHPALTDFAYEARYDETEQRMKWWISAGTPTWVGQDLTVCQQNIHTWGITSFRQEAQHEVDLLLGGMYDDVEFAHIQSRDLPELVAKELWLDPAVSSGTGSHSQGLQIDGIDKDKRLYRLYSWEGVMSPEAILKKAIKLALSYSCRAVGIETDQGGDTWELSFNSVWRQMEEDGEIPKGSRKPQYKSAKAGSVGGKIERQNLMRLDYDSGKIIHVYGTHETLEKALKRFPEYEPLDLADAAFWGWYHLRHRGGWTR